MFLLGGCGGGGPDRYEQGLEKLEKQKYTEAIEAFQDAIQEGVKTTEAWRGIGISWTEQGIFDKAEEAFETALGLTEKSEKAARRDLFLYLVDSQYQQDDYQACIETCGRLLEEGKERDAYFLRGSAYLHLGEYKKADSDFGKATARSKEYGIYLDIYKVYQECELSADGEEYLESALELPSRNAADFYNRGRIYYYLSEYSQAEKSLEKALDKKDYRAGIYLGKVCLASGDVKKAKAAYEKCLDIEETKAAAYNGLAYCAMQEEDYEKALSYLEKGLKMKNPAEEQALLFNEIVLYEKKSDFASAKEKIAAYLEKYPADENAVRENYFLETR